MFPVIGVLSITMPQRPMLPSSQLVPLALSLDMYTVRILVEPWVSPVCRATGLPGKRMLKCAFREFGPGIK